VSALDALWSALEARGVRLHLSEGRLRYEGPPGSVSPELQRAMAEHRQELSQRVWQREGFVPSASQRRLVASHRLSEDPSHLNLVFALRIDEPFEEARLAEALHHVLAHHRSLQLGFRDTERGLRAFLDPQAPARGRLLRDERAPLLGACALRDLPFSLEQPPLVRAALLGPEAETLAVVVHHAICDGPSSRRLLGDLSRVYLGHRWPESLDYPVHPPTVPSPTTLQYWSARLQGAQRLDLGPHRARVPDGFRASFVAEHELGTPLAAALTAGAARLRTTPFQLVACAFAAWLGRVGRAEEVVVGTEVVEESEGEGAAIAARVNPLALRITIPPDASLAALYAANRQALLSDLEHRAVDYEVLVAHLRGAGQRPQPLFNTSVTLHPDLFAPLTFAGRPARPLSLPTANTYVDLELSVFHGVGLRVVLRGDQGLFSEAVVRDMAAGLGAFLAQAVADLDRPLRTLPCAAGESLRRGADAALPPPVPPFSVAFATQVAATPQAVALTTQAESWTYARLEQQAATLRAALRRRGVVRGAVVGVMCERGSHLVLALVALLTQAVTYVPLDPQQPDARLARMAQRSGCALVLYDEAHTQRAAALGETPRLSLEALLEEEGAAPPVAAHPTEVAYLLFTSGSTGVPKAAMVAHQGLMGHLAAKVGHFAIGPSDVVAQTAAMGFDISLWQMLAPLTVGAQVAVLTGPEAMDGPSLLRAAAQRGVTILQTVPSLLRTMVLQPSPAGSLRLLVSTGEELKQQLAQAWYEAFPEVPLVNAYGPTECSDDVTHGWVVACAERPESGASIGRPIAGASLYVLDRQGWPVPQGVTGEICVGGPCVGYGYWGDARQTALAFRPDPFAVRPGQRLYKTGDLGRWQGDGSLDYLGREDAQVKIHGQRLDLGEVEAQLEQMAEVESAVVGLQPKGSARLLVAWVTWRGQARLEAEALRARLREQLAGSMVPAVFVFLERLPLLPSGKVDRAALPTPRWQAQGSRPPQTATERAIADLMADVLGDDVVLGDAETPFMQLGGDSLMAIELVRRFRERGWPVALRDLLERGSVAEIGRWLAESGAKL
jgi:amino acid adenylation domain-containing protein